MKKKQRRKSKAGRRPGKPGRASPKSRFRKRRLVRIQSVRVKLPGPIQGFAIKSVRAGEPVRCQATGTVFSDEGDWFVTLGNNISDAVLNAASAKLGGDANAASMDCLGVCQADGTVDVYLHPFESVSLRIKGVSVEKGQPIMVDDVATIERVNLGDLDVPDGAGVFAVMSRGWLRCIWFDFSPLRGDGRLRTIDVERALARNLNYMLFQHLFTITTEEWEQLVASGWFPFCGLRHATIQKLLAHLRATWSLDEVMDDIAQDVDALLPTLLARFENNDLLIQLLPHVREAVELHSLGKHMASVALSFPAAEGVMRAYFTAHGATREPKHETMPDMVARSDADPTLDLFGVLLPTRFRAFLRATYLKHSDWRTPKGITRHTVAHGVAPATEDWRKASLLGLLMLFQLTFHAHAVEDE